MLLVRLFPPSPFAVGLLRATQRISSSDAAILVSKRSLTSEPVDDTSRTELDFRDHERIFKGQTTGQLLRAWVVFRLCSIPAFVDNAQHLLNIGNRLLGKQLTHGLLKMTFFNHFCAGKFNVIQKSFDFPCAFLLLRGEPSRGVEDNEQFKNKGSFGDS